MKKKLIWSFTVFSWVLSCSFLTYAAKSKAEPERRCVSAVIDLTGERDTASLHSIPWSPTDKPSLVYVLVRDPKSRSKTSPSERFAALLKKSRLDASVTRYEIGEIKASLFAIPVTFEKIDADAAIMYILNTSRLPFYAGVNPPQFGPNLQKLKGNAPFSNLAFLNDDIVLFGSVVFKPRLSPKARTKLLRDLDALGIETMRFRKTGIFYKAPKAAIAAASVLADVLEITFTTGEARHPAHPIGGI